MVKEILRGQKTPKALAAAADLPPLNAADQEYLFLQLLEGIVHGWQQPRVIKFFTKIKHRVPKSQWLEWLESYGQKLLAEPNPSEDLARRMIQLSELDCGEITSLAGDYGHQVLSKIYGGYTNEFLPELEGSGIELGYLPDFGTSEMDLVAMDLDFQPETPLPEMQFADSPAAPSPMRAVTQASANPLEGRISSTPTNPVWEDNVLPTFGEVPEELRLSNRRSATPSPPPSSIGMSGDLALDDTIEQLDPINPIDPLDGEVIEERQISIEEFDMMLRNDPELLQQIAQQLGIETTDPQVVVDHVMAQMQEQIQDSGQL